MMIGKCPKCGIQYFGWALVDMQHTNCSSCGAQLEITRDGQIAGEPTKPLHQSKHVTNNYLKNSQDSVSPNSSA